MNPLHNSPEFLDLSAEKQEIINSIEDGQNIFVTGGAGTGKSYLLNFVKRHFQDRGLAVTASTGIAAVNISGVTIHSWSGIGLANLPISEIVKNIFSARMNKVRNKILRSKILAIDEISMISAQTFDIIDQVLRQVRQENLPMGGMQILLFGDFLQLPPVTKNSDNQESQEFCFNSEAWQSLNFNIFQLKEIYRQTDSKFIKILNNLRFNNLDQQDYKLLESRVNASDNNVAIKPTILTSHNFRADAINYDELKNIPSEEKTFEAIYSGDKFKVMFLQKNCIAPAILRLKIGSQVMMIKNCYQKEGIINGSLGVVKDFSKNKNYPIVEFNNGKIIKISPEEWAVEKFDENKKVLKTEASVSQIPLILSWAITIHKSQGLTLDKISCDLSNIFSAGQAYVALSRARSLDGVFIKSIDFNKIFADEKAVQFYKNYE